MGSFGREGVASLNDMKDMLAGLPQYQEMREKVTVILELYHDRILILPSFPCI